MLTNVRGPLAIHASKALPSYVREDYDQSPFAQAVLHREFGVRRFADLRHFLPFGCVVATVDLVQVLPTESKGFRDLEGRLYEIPLPGTPEFDFGNYAPGRAAWFLEDIKQLPTPVPVDAKQGFFFLEGDVLAAVTSQAGVLR